MRHNTQTIEHFRKISRALLICFSAGSLLMAALMPITRTQFAPGRAILFLAVTGAAILVLWRNSWQLGKRQIELIILLALTGLFASLLFKDDYSGGEWFLHLHRGYPYSWRDGVISLFPGIENGVTVLEYVAQNPTLVQWTVDLPALMVDSVFWLNAGILIILFGNHFFINKKPAVFFL
jgi:hypothetical protein